MQIKIYSKIEQKQNPNFLDWVIVPDQTHSNNIVEIKTWKEDLTNCDWIFTSKKNNFKLGIKTADCSAIVFEDEKYYWIIHAGWRGLVNWIIEKMLEKFENPRIFVAPFYKKFEIKKDFCYDEMLEKFLDKFFWYHPHPLLSKEGSFDEKIIFDFEKALKYVLWEKAIFDKRDTFLDKNFYSWRRERTKERNYTIICK